MLLDPLIARTIGIGLGLMFALAAWHKASDAASFRVTLLEYQVLPDALVAPATRIVPIIEFLLALGWLTALYRPELTATASAVVLGAYGVAIAVNLVRGRAHFDCGCGFGGTHDREQFLSWGLVVRNAILTAAALITLAPASSRALGAGDYATLVAALIAAALLFGASNQLLANRAAIDLWRKPRD